VFYTCYKICHRDTEDTEGTNSLQLEVES